MATANLNWEDFDKFHAVRRLRQIAASWWKIQLNFTDEKGFLRGVPQGRFFNPIHRICQSVTQTERGFKACMGTVKKTSSDASTNAKAELGRCHAGFSTLTVPIRVGGKYLGCVFGDGFIVEETEQEQKEALRRYLHGQFEGEERLVSYIDKLPVLSRKEVEYLTDLIEMVVDEIINTHASLKQAERKVIELKAELGKRYNFDKMVGKSLPMQELYGLLERVCDSDALILIQGENGTGKELIAKALHYNSKRQKMRFVVANCGAFNENLLESELFGHVRGAFTGAVKDKIGLFEAANGGTLFLDEIGDMSMAMQVKLLRVLQEGTFSPVGSTETRRSTARVVCATNKDLAMMVEEGSFRQDLFYRLNVINLVVPPLRTRLEDIAMLTESFIKRFCDASHIKPKKISEDCLEKLLNYDWPGNVRELENEIERLCVLAGNEPTLKESSLSQRIREGVSPGGQRKNRQGDGSLRDAIEDLEKQMIEDGLIRNGWNKSQAAKELGISRAGLIMKVEKYHLEKKTAKKRAS